MYAYMQELVERKERELGNDLISRLVTEYVVTGQLDRATAAVTSVIMMQAGHETTADMLSLGTVALLQHPDVFERLGQTDDPSVVANVVEELMRYLSIVHSQVDSVATDRHRQARLIPEPLSHQRRTTCRYRHSFRYFRRLCQRARLLTCKKAGIMAGS
jgi:cytochrome P450